MNKPVSRREFLRMTGLAALSVAAASCTPAATTTPVQPTAAATSAQATKAPEATKSSAATTAPSTKAKMKISWAVWVTAPIDANNNLVKKAIEDKFNVELTMLPFERATWADQINTRVAGGDVPDIIYRDGRSGVLTYLDQGVLAEVPLSAIKSSAPKTFAAVNKFSTDAWLATFSGGKNYGLPLMQPQQLYPFTDGYRKDWLDKLGVKVPTTLTEVEDVWTKMTTGDPDGDGKANTYALSMRGKDWIGNDLSAIYGAFGIFPGHWMQLSDRIERGCMMDEAKKAFAWLNSMYKKGVIDPEFVTTDWAALKQKWSNGKIGLASTTWYRLIPSGEIYDSLLAVNPKADVVMAPPPKGPDGKQGYFNWGPVTSSLCFGKQLAKDQDKMARCLEILEWCLSDVEFSTLVHYGTQNVNWERDAKTNGIINKAPFTTPESRGPLGTAFLAAIPGSPEAQDFAARKDQNELTAYAKTCNVTNYLPMIGNFVPADIGKKTPDMDPTINRWMIDFITGAKSPDKDWAQYQKEVNDAGYKTYYDAVQAAGKTIASEQAAIKAQIG